MNERIEELIKQADIEFDVSSDHYGVDTAVVIPYDLEKFAELIVRECIDVIGEENYTMLTGKAYCTKLKRHFGIK